MRRGPRADRRTVGRGLLAAAAISLAATARGATAQTHLIVVSGLGGEPVYAKAFRDWSTTLLGAARHVAGIPAANLTWLAETADSADGLVARKATKQAVTQAIATVAGAAEANATVVIVLIGHGTAGATPAESRFDLPGPDITARELSLALAAFTTQTVVVINAASASGDWIPVLSAPRRVVITADRTGTEVYATQFPRFIAAALADSAADADKDGRLSVLEVFEYARKQVAHLYESAGKLATEHPQLDDDGDGKGTGTPNAQQGDGVLAASIFFDMPRASAAATADTAVRRLYASRDSLNRALADLRRVKAGMDSTAYSREEERLLLELARNGAAIRAKGGH